MRSSLSNACGELTTPLLHRSSRTVPAFLCPILLRSSAQRHRSTPQRRPLVTSTSALPVPSLPDLQSSASPSHSQHDGTVSKTGLALPAICPGCGALQQTVKPGEAGYYSTSRKSVKAFIAKNGDSWHSNRTPEDHIWKAAVEKADDGLLSDLGLDTIVAATGEPQHCELANDGTQDTNPICR